MSRTPQETFRELTDKVGALIAGDTGQAHSLAGLYAQSTHVSFPLTPDAEPLRTREALQAHFTAVASRLAGTVTTLHADRVRLHETTDPEMIVAEFDYVGQGPQGEFTLPHVFVMRVRDGEIVESRDYSASQA